MGFSFARTPAAQSATPPAPPAPVGDGIVQLPMDGLPALREAMKAHPDLKSALAIVKKELGPVKLSFKGVPAAMTANALVAQIPKDAQLRVFKGEALADSLAIPSEEELQSAYKALSGYVKNGNDVSTAQEYARQLAAGCKAWTGVVPEAIRLYRKWCIDSAAIASTLYADMRASKNQAKEPVQLDIAEQAGVSRESEMEHYAAKLWEGGRKAPSEGVKGKRGAGGMEYRLGSLVVFKASRTRPVMEKKMVPPEERPHNIGDFRYRTADAPAPKEILVQSVKPQVNEATGETEDVPQVTVTESWIVAAYSTGHRIGWGFPIADAAKMYMLTLLERWPNIAEMTPQQRAETKGAPIRLWWDVSSYYFHKRRADAEGRAAVKADQGEQAPAEGEEGKAQKGARRKKSAKERAAEQTRDFLSAPRAEGGGGEGAQGAS